MRSDLAKLVAALNRDARFTDAESVQQVLVKLDGLLGLSLTDRWAWPPRFDKDGAYVLVGMRAPKITLGCQHDLNHPNTTVVFKRESKYHHSCTVCQREWNES